MNIRLILCLTFCVGLLTSCSEEPGSAEKSVATKSSSKDDIIASLSDEIIENPNDANLYIKRALIYQNRNQMNLAIKDAERALTLDSTASYFHQVLGELNFLRGQLGPARQSLERAAELDESNTDALLKLAEVQFLLRRYEESINSINTALVQNDRLAQGYFIKGYVYKEIGDTTLAKSSFQTVIEINPEHYEGYMELGSLFALEGDPLALEYFNSALELKPKSAEAFYHKGMFLQAGSRYLDAKNTYRELLQVDRGNVLAFYNLGYLYLTEFLEFDTAIAYFDSALAIRPDYIEAMVNKGLAQEELELFGDAENSYRAALSVDPQFDPAAKGLSRLLE